MSLAKRSWLVFLIAAAVFYLYGLGHLPLVGPDEPRYAEVAREMYLRGDYVTPTLGGHTWFEKPALLYWMMIGGYRLFGVSEWAARLGPAISGLLTIFLIYWMGRRSEHDATEEDGTGRGLWSGVALASSAGLIAFSRAASFDVVVTMTMTAALACFFVSESESEDKRRRLLLAAFYAAVGVSLLAKGLVGIVVPFGVIGLYYLMRREWPRKAVILSGLWGIPLVLSVAAIWYGPVIARHGWTFVDEFFIQHHFARFVSNKYRHPQPIYFYLPIMALLTLPWVAFLVAELIGARRWRWREKNVKSRLRVFALAWLVVPVAFFSFSGSKLPGYVLPALPGAMLLAGERLRRFVRGAGGEGLMRATGTVLLTLALGAVVYAVRTGEVTTACALLIAAPLILASIAAIALKGRRALRAELVYSAMFIATALALNCVAGRIGQQYAVRDLMRLADARGYGSAPVFYMLEGERTAEFYAGGRLGYRPDGEPYRFDGAFEVADAARAKGGTALVLIPTIWERQLTGYAAIETEVIGRNGVLSLALIRVRQGGATVSAAGPN
ncbi:MAG TPA: glycosyltransferase family 39 protein [Pyrinomonadaceae bacterium]|nr:glycosyltransferase family 39 protein [Pyrinomonadaceae bacterium]